MTLVNKTNANFFSEHIIKQVDINDLKSDIRRKDFKKSNKLIANAYIYFKNNIESLIEKGKNIEQFVAEVTRSMDNNLSVIQIKVKDDYDAYLLFETLNDRGLDLSVSDLLKNYLFSKSENQLQNVQENWEEMVSSLGQHEVKSFLRHYWLSTEGIVREKDLYRAIAGKYTAKRSVLNFSKQLRDSAAFYGALSDVDSGWWDAFDPAVKRKIKSHIEQLNLFNVSQCYPLL